MKGSQKRAVDELGAQLRCLTLRSVAGLRKKTKEFMTENYLANFVQVRDRVNSVWKFRENGY